MTVFYTPSDDAFLAKRRQERGSLDCDLVLCRDGIYRTMKEKIAFDKAFDTQLKVIGW